MISKTNPLKKFLAARWHNLVMANYTVAPELLQDFLPNGVELDFWNNECYVSLVAFEFLDTKVRGLRIPFHVNFEEVNLRFYVRRETADETRRGVVFVKEIVPRLAIAFVARAFYGEPYETWKMAHESSQSEISYSWMKGDCANQIKVSIGDSLGVPANDSHGEFIIEHYWGYTKRGAGRTDEYKVEHPKWELLEVGGAEIAVDFGKIYGEQFAFLSNAQPISILLAKGSEISVYKGAKMQPGAERE
ncbi:MAG: DUF2071 domain-containing protein [Pyrinomonadaceae bacterium]